MVLTVLAFGAGIVFGQKRSQSAARDIDSPDSLRAKTAEGAVLDEGGGSANGPICVASNWKYL
jgi:hypothetical protein